MSEGLLLPTEKTNVYLKQLSPEDADAYFAAVDANREHLSQFGDETAAKYPDVDSVKASIEEPSNPSKMRFGIWDNNEFVGTINATPGETGTEIGYWLDARKTGKGYATLAARSLTSYLQGTSDTPIFAEVMDGNQPSEKVLKRAGYRQVANQAGKLIFEFAGYVPPLLEDGQLDLNAFADDHKAGKTPPPIPMEQLLATAGYHGMHFVNPEAHPEEELGTPPDIDAIRQTLHSDSGKASN